MLPELVILASPSLLPSSGRAMLRTMPCGRRLSVAVLASLPTPALTAPVLTMVVAALVWAVDRLSTKMPWSAAWIAAPFVRLASLPPLLAASLFSKR